MVRVYKPPMEYSKKNNTEIPKISFFPDLILFANRKTVSATIDVAGTSDWYIVPQGRTFFLCGGHLALGKAAATAADSLTISVASASGSSLFIFGDIQQSATGAEPISTSVPLVFPLPLIVNSGERIRTTRSLSILRGSFSIYGYEIDNSLIPRFT